MSSQKVYSALSYGALFLGIDPSITSPAIGLLLTLPNSRAAESEADHVRRLGSVQRMITDVQHRSVSSWLAVHATTLPKL